MSDLVFSLQLSKHRKWSQSFFRRCYVEKKKKKKKEEKYPPKKNTNKKIQTFEKKRIEEKCYNLIEEKGVILKKCIGALMIHPMTLNRANWHLWTYLSNIPCL